jgi:hypothetical protein
MVIASVVRLSRGERLARGWRANELRKYNAAVIGVLDLRDQLGDRHSRGHPDAGLLGGVPGLGLRRAHD